MPSTKIMPLVSQADIQRAGEKAFNALKVVLTQLENKDVDIFHLVVDLNLGFSSEDNPIVLDRLNELYEIGVRHIDLVGLGENIANGTKTQITIPNGMKVTASPNSTYSKLKLILDESSIQAIKKTVTRTKGQDSTKKPIIIVCTHWVTGDIRLFALRELQGYDVRNVSEDVAKMAAEGRQTTAKPKNNAFSCLYRLIPFWHNTNTKIQPARVPQFKD